MPDDNKDDIMIRTRTGLHNFAVREEVQDRGKDFQPGPEDAGQLGRVRTRPGGEMRRSTEARMCHGE